MRWDPIPVHDVDSPVASPLDHRRHVMSTEFPAQKLLPECGFARHHQHHPFTTLRPHCLEVSHFSSLSGVTLSQHHDMVSYVTPPSHKSQDGCRRQDSAARISETGYRRQDFGDRILDTGFRILLSSAALLLTNKTNSQVSP